MRLVRFEDYALARRAGVEGVLDSSGVELALARLYDRSGELGFQGGASGGDAKFHDIAGVLSERQAGGEKR